MFNTIRTKYLGKKVLLGLIKGLKFYKSVKYVRQFKFCINANVKSSLVPAVVILLTVHVLTELKETELQTDAKKVHPVFSSEIHTKLI